ncbi:MAG: FAD-dependent oxidoreductase [Armatimonadetes bacterium]|nr:FAD-dependent oxidoreductase [Armatimonadota bacterium]
MRNRIQKLARKPVIMAILVGLLFASQSLYVSFGMGVLEGASDYDVIVVGSDPEGIAAAVSSARNGMRTLLVDDREKLGGLWTVGGLNFIDMNRGPDKESVVKGIFQEFYNAINDPGKANKTESFDIGKAVAIFQKMVSCEPNLVVRLKTPVVDVLKQGDAIVGVVIESDGKRVELRAKRVIDATQDADIAAKAGAPYYVGMEDFNRPGEFQPMSLIFEMGNVDWKLLHLRAQEYRRKKGFGGATDGSVWGFLDVMKKYKQQHGNIMMRGLNVGKLAGKNVLINSMLIMGVDPLNANAKRQALAEANEEIKPLAAYIIKNVPGFKNSYLIGGMRELYVRESRHVVGQYRLTVNDMIENRDFADKIALGSYPLDIQTTSSSNIGYVLGRPKVYSVPFRCLVPKNVQNLLVVGRCASYDSLAHSSARTVPIGMATGQAAGVACSYSIREGAPFDKIASSSAITSIQKTLRMQGVRLDKLNYGQPYNGHWALHYIRFLRGLGMLASGYNNYYWLDAPVPSERIIVMTVKCEKRCFVWRGKSPPDIFKLKAVNKDQAARMLLYMENLDYAEDRPLDSLVTLGMIQKSTADKVSKMRKYNNAAWFMMLHDYIDYRMETGVRMKALGPHVDNPI